MKAVWLVVLFGLGGLARAQDGDVDAAVDPVDPVDPAAPAEAPSPLATAWVTADATTTRFLDAPTPGPELRAGTEVKVLVRDGDHARVMAGTRFGWVEADELADTRPTGAAPEPTVLTLPQ